MAVVKIPIGVLLPTVVRGMTQKMAVRSFVALVMSRNPNNHPYAQFDNSASVSAAATQYRGLASKPESRFSSTVQSRNSPWSQVAQR